MRKSNIKNEAIKWDKVYNNFSGEQSVWVDLNSAYEGASPYIIDKIKKLPKSVKTLDAGCGDGRNLIYLKKQGYNVSGIDISKKAIEKIKKTFEAYGLDADLTVADLYDLPYEDANFDVVYCDLVNVHLKNPKVILRKFNRVLKPGGLLLFETASKYDSLCQGQKEFYDENFYFRFYDKQKIVDLVGKYFRVRNVEYNTILNYDHGLGFASRKKHCHKSYLLVAIKE